MLSKFYFIYYILLLFYLLYFYNTIIFYYFLPIYIIYIKFKKNIYLNIKYNFFKIYNIII